LLATLTAVRPNRGFLFGESGVFPGLYGDYFKERFTTEERRFLERVGNANVALIFPHVSMWRK
jgi:hypothetical protein